MILIRHPYQPAFFIPASLLRLSASLALLIGRTVDRYMVCAFVKEARAGRFRPLKTKHLPPTQYASVHFTYTKYM